MTFLGKSGIKGLNVILGQRGSGLAPIYQGKTAGKKNESVLVPDYLDSREK